MKLNACVTIAALAFMTAAASAQIPERITYQGVLQKTDGESVEDGTYSLTYRLYDAVLQGTEVWSETQRSEVRNGVFNAILGSLKPLDIPFNKPLWLGISVDSGQELVPRMELTAAAYSLMARSVADNSITATKIPNRTVLRSMNGLMDDIVLAAGDHLNLTVIGNTLTFSADSSCGLELPFSATDTSSSPLFSITNTIGGGAAAFANFGEYYGNPALKVTSHFAQPAIYAENTAGIDYGGIPGGPAGRFRITNASNASSALVASTNGEGNAISASSSNLGTTIYAVHEGLGSAGYFKNTYDQPALVVDTDGSGYIVTFSSSAAEKVVIEASGDVGIGTATPSNILTVAQSSATDPIADSWTVYSSRRWKENITPIQAALEKVEQLQGVTYTWKADGKKDIGLIAEDVGRTIPEVVAWEENGTDAKSVDYARLVAVLIEAVKEQQKQIAALEERLNRLSQ